MDLRLAQFGVNRVARAPIYHMAAIVHRMGNESFRLMVFRSMAKTAWHELAVALDTLAARAPRV
jgi:sarcosine oxidase subunit gamma